METSQAPVGPGRRGRSPLARRSEAVWALGSRVSWVGGLVLALSAFTGWYTGTGDFPLAVIGWDTGLLGKLVFVAGAAVVALTILREAGIHLPPAAPESLVVIALGSLAAIAALVRLISVPEEFLPAGGRGIGIWISLVAALVVIAGGLLRASEEL